MQNRKSFLGAGTDAMFAAMEHWWNRPPFRLHHVTAREAYNIVKAAEAGCHGDPNDFRDFLIPPPANRLIRCTGDFLLRHYTPERVRLELLAPEEVRVEFAEGNLRSVRARRCEMEVDYHRRRVAALRVRGSGPIHVDPPGCAAALRSTVETQRRAG